MLPLQASDNVICWVCFTEWMCLCSPAPAVRILDSLCPLPWLRVLVFSLSDMLCVILYLLAPRHGPLITRIRVTGLVYLYQNYIFRKYVEQLAWNLRYERIHFLKSVSYKQYLNAERSFVLNSSLCLMKNIAICLLKLEFNVFTSPNISEMR